MPADALEFARTAAGFWHSTLSPMHGALLAAAIANHGEMPAPTLVERAFDAQGREMSRELRRSVAQGPHRVVGLDTAREVGRMMELTTRIGTAKAAFHDRRGHRYLPVDVAGKTGTLSAQTERGYLGYSWFIGYAPADHPAIAFAVALGNPAQWRIKATYVARRIVSEHLAAQAPGRTPVAPATRDARNSANARNSLKTGMTPPGRSTHRAPNRRSLWVFSVPVGTGHV